MPARDSRLRAPENEALNVIGSRVRERRRVVRLKQQGLAARIAEATGNRWMPSSLDITRIETGIRTCVDTEVLAIAAALACDPGWLIAGDLCGKGAESIEWRPAMAPWQEGKG